jgi:hypothetical protein
MADLIFNESSLDVANADDTPKERVISVTNTNNLDRNKERMIRMSQVVSKFASTLTLRHIKVHLEKDPQTNAPAWSDADNIWFATQQLGDLTDPKNVTAVRGLSLHELSHILMTPRAGSNIATWVRQNNLWRAFNGLEDMRIEMMITTKYPSTTDWLVATIAQHMLDKASKVPFMYPIIHGRKYLPIEVRQAVRDVYKDQHNVVRIGQLIDEYITLNLSNPDDVIKAMPIIQEFNSLVKELRDEVQDGWGNTKDGWSDVDDPFGHDCRKDGELKSSSTSKPMSKAEQQAILDRMMKKRQQEYEDNPDGKNSKDNSSGADSKDAYGEGIGQYDGPDISAGLMDILQNTVDDTNERLKNEIDQTIKQFNGDADLHSHHVETPPKAGYYSRPVSYDAVSGSRSFGTELELLRADHDPGWDRQVDSGRLNVQRYGTGCAVDEAFDQWNMGREDAVDIECVILLDTSPSMSWTIEKAYENMWAIKRAMDKINASTTVLAFDDKVRVLYSANERAGIDNRYAGMGYGTDPLASLKYAKYLLAESDRAIKIVISITDGAWSQTDACDDILRQLRGAGVITALAFVDDTEWHNETYKDMMSTHPWLVRSNEITIDSHGCEVSVLVNGADDLFQLAKRMVKVGIQRNLING